MMKTMCYEEFCGPSVRIPFWNFVLAALVILTAVSAVVTAGVVFADLEPVVIPWYPTDF